MHHGIWFLTWHNNRFAMINNIPWLSRSAINATIDHSMCYTTKQLLRGLVKSDVQLVSLVRSIICALYSHPVVQETVLVNSAWHCQVSAIQLSLEWRHISIRDSQISSDVRMGAIASQITSLTIVYLTIYSDADQRKCQSSASLAFVWGIHRGPVNSPHKGPVTRNMFPFDDVIMSTVF